MAKGSMRGAAGGTAVMTAGRRARLRSEESKAREKALIDAGVSKNDVYRRLVAHGVTISPNAVRAVIYGIYGRRRLPKTDAVMDAFCELTGTDKDAMWPQSESAA